jgi:hypothetical protein
VDDLELAEAEMAEAAADAGLRLKVALSWLRCADADLAVAAGPLWGGRVNDWHRAADAVADSAEAVAAFEAFSNYTA